jgi:hypothetical protein
MTTFGRLLSVATGRFGSVAARLSPEGPLPCDATTEGAQPCLSRWASYLGRHRQTHPFAAIPLSRSSARLADEFNARQGRPLQYQRGGPRAPGESAKRR